MPRRKKPSGRHGKFKVSRPLSALARRQGNRIPRKRLIIVCEATQTEPNYFQAMRQKYRLSTLNIQIVRGKGDPKNVVREAIKQRRDLDGPNDQVWCVFDTEVRAKNPAFDQAVDSSGSAKLNLAVSNPAFEYWYLLHFECSDRPFRDADNLVDELKKHVPHYDKSVDVFSELDPRTDLAIENAAQLRQRASEPWSEFPNPSTCVDKLVLSILKLIAS